ncbi:MAG TPA: TetR/AcrR family transcriptional regulator [Acidimicrobiales bacterium]
MTEAGRRVPRTGRGEQTRDVLLASAREVFWEKGYLDTRVADIAEHAGVSHGSFYTYFDSKEDVLWAIASDLSEITVSTARGVRREAGGDEVKAIEMANRRYLQMYLDNRKVMRLMEDVATFNPEMRDARIATRTQFVHMSTRSIKRLQEQGRADPSLDAACAATALVGMVSSFAYQMVSAQTVEFDLDTAVHTLTTLWARGIGLKEVDEPRDGDGDGSDGDAATAAEAEAAGAGVVRGDGHADLVASTGTDDTDTAGDGATAADADGNDSDGDDNDGNDGDDPAA